MPEIRYVLVGGFLGAGKTTAVLAMARYLGARGRRVGLIANDQSEGLVDTERMRMDGHRVEEISGGCFCCRFDALVDSSFAMTGIDDPDVLIAEPVGSCTDLQATVTYPLRQRFGETFTVAPFSVLVDPLRCGAFLGLWGRHEFSDTVAYVYRKQLEEAEIIVVHKSDLISSSRRDLLMAELHRQFPDADVLAASSFTGEGVDEWYRRLLTEELGRRSTMEIDYDVYAEGESRLGWVNTRGAVAAAGGAPFDGNRFLATLCTDLSSRLDDLGIAIAHLKATLTANGGGHLGAVSVTSTTGSASASSLLDAPVQAGELIVNLRAEADPEVLRRELQNQLDARPEVYLGSDEAAFRPARPVPTHRMTSP